MGSTRELEGRTVAGRSLSCIELHVPSIESAAKKRALHAVAVSGFNQLTIGSDDGLRHSRLFRWLLRRGCLVPRLGYRFTLPRRLYRIERLAWLRCVCPGIHCFPLT